MFDDINGLLRKIEGQTKPWPKKNDKKIDNG